MSDKKKQKENIILIITFVTLIVGIILLFFFLNSESKADVLQEDVANAYKEKLEVVEDDASTPEQDGVSEVSSDPINKIGETIVEVKDSKFSDVLKPANMRAIYIAAGKDFYLDDTNTMEDVKTQIAEIFDKMAELGFNSAIIDASYNDKIIYTSQNISAVADEDMLSIISTIAEEKDIYTYVSIDVKKTFDLKSQTSRMNVADNEKIEGIINEVSQVLNNYSINGVVLNGYDIGDKKQGYKEYSATNLGIGYSRYLKNSNDNLVNGMVKSLKEKFPSKEVGLLVDGVWANASSSENGLKTTSTHEQFLDGFSDTKAYIESGEADFVIVENKYTTSIKYEDDIPVFEEANTTSDSYEEIARWWGEIAQTGGSDLYFFHYSDKIDSGDEKWGNENELANQVRVSKGIVNYSGSIFNSFSHIYDNKSETKELLLKELDVAVVVDEAPIAIELQITNLKSFEFTTEEPNIIIMGSSDPKEPLTINGKEMKRNEAGYFSYNAQLDIGTNVYEFVHKEKTIKVSISKKIQIFSTVAPNQTITAEGGGALTVMAYAYDGSLITATLGGTSVTLKKAEASDGDNENMSSYQKFSAEIILPAGKSVEQPLGHISFTASWNGVTQSMSGGNVVVNPFIEKINSAGESTGQLVEIVATAETFSPKEINNKSDPNRYALPKGAIDRIVSDKIVYTEDGKNYEFYNLASGNRVYASAVSQISAERQGNKIAKMTVKSDGIYTYVLLENSEKISYNMSVVSGVISYKFTDTNQVTESISTLTKNPIFSSAEWSGTTLNLITKATSTGFTPYYDGNILVLRFKNPLSATSATVVIDPGHSTIDPGALGYYPDLNERELNVAVAGKVISKLSAYGVTVKEVPTAGATTLDSRVAFSNSSGADLFVSIHHNSSVSQTASGTEVYYFTNNSQSLAKNIVNAIASKTGLKNRGGRFGHFIVTKKQNCPAVLVECGFVSNRDEYNNLIQDGTQEQVADGIVEGILSFLNGRSVTNITGEESVGSSNTTVSLPEESSLSAPSSSSSESSAQDSSWSTAEEYGYSSESSDGMVTVDFEGNEVSGNGS